MRDYSKDRDLPLTIIEFMCSIFPDSDAGSRSGFLEVGTWVAKSPKCTKAQFKMMLNDLLEWLSYVPDQQLLPLNAILMDKYGYSLNDIRVQKASFINKIIRRGHISNEDEWRVVRSVVDAMFLDVKTKAKAEQLMVLLERFEMGKATDNPGAIGQTDS